MTVASVYTIGHVSIDTPSLLIDQIESAKFSPNMKEIVKGADGQVDPTFVAVGQIDPDFSITTTALATVLAAGSNLFLTQGIHVTTGDVTTWLQQIELGGTRMGATSHIKAVASLALVYPTGFNAPSTDLATMDINVAAYSSDGSTSPWVFTASQSMSGTPNVSEGFVAGPVSINGTTYGSVQSIRYDSGIGIKKVWGPGEVYPTFVYIQERRPSFTIEVMDMSVLTAIDFDGLAQGATDSVIYLRKVDRLGTRVASGTAQHISLTLDDGLISIDGPNGSQGGEYSATIKITPAFDGTNAIVAVSAAAAIA